MGLIGACSRGGVAAEPGRSPRSRVEALVTGRSLALHARLGWVVLLAAALTGSLACREEAPRLRVFAAASLTEVVQRLVLGYEGMAVEPSLGGSSALARQIRDGAAADVFLSASPEWIEFLRESDALAGDPIVLARNRLVAIVPEQSALAAQAVSGPRELLQQIGTRGRVAIADEGVPAGEYARSALRASGVLSAFESQLVGQKDVRAVLSAVERGEIEAGFVYATDAKVAAVKVLFAFDPATHPPIEYRAAVLRGAQRPDEAQSFLAFLHGDRARAILVEAGFALP